MSPAVLVYMILVSSPLLNYPSFPRQRQCKRWRAVTSTVNVNAEPTSTTDLKGIKINGFTENAG